MTDPRAELEADLRARLVKNPDDEGAARRYIDLALLGGAARTALPLLDRLLARWPTDAVLWAQRGLARHLKGAARDAIADHRRALALSPNAAALWLNLGASAQAIGADQMALAAFQRVVTIDPDHRDGLTNLTTLGNDLGLDELARSAAGRLLAVTPTSQAALWLAAINALSIVYPDTAATDAARQTFDTSLAHLEQSVARLGPGDLRDGLAAATPYFLAYHGRNDRDLMVRIGRLIHHAVAEFAAPLPSRPPRRRRRIGIVSRYFQRHSIWKIPLHGWLTGLDRDRFELIAYHTGRETDATTALARTMVDCFRSDLGAPKAWAAAIRADAPDVLLYPEIGIDPISWQLAALRLAPRQYAFGGHPTTTGIATIDGHLSSAAMEPDDGAAHYSEPLIRLPGLGVTYWPEPVDPEPITRADLGLSATAPIFWCAQMLAKYRAEDDHLLARIAAALPTAQFVFLSFPRGRAVTDRLRQRLVNLGLTDGQQIIFLPPLSPSRFAGAMRLADVFLDSVGWSGNNTTMESLAVPLPIVTWPGALMRARHAAGILTELGCADLIARDADDYVSRAVALGRDPARRELEKSRLAAGRARVIGDSLPAEALTALLAGDDL